VFPELRPECRQNLSSVYIDPATTTPLSYLVAPGALDAAVKEHPGARIIVSLIGVPVNLRQTRTWTTASGKSLALLLPDLRMVGNQADIRQALQSGQIAAMVLNKPGAPGRRPEDGIRPAIPADQRGKRRCGAQGISAPVLVTSLIRNQAGLGQFVTV
jgi:hypothetical protein